MATKPNIREAKHRQDDLLAIPHPGETLKEDFMVPLGLSAYAVAKAVGSTPITISMIARGKRSVSAEMAIRLGIYTGTGPEFWWNLQSSYALRMAQRRKSAAITKRVAPLPRPDGIRTSPTCAPPARARRANRSPRSG